MIRHRGMASPISASTIHPGRRAHVVEARALFAIRARARSNSADTLPRSPASRLRPLRLHGQRFNTWFWESARAPIGCPRKPETLLPRMSVRGLLRGRGFWDLRVVGESRLVAVARKPVRRSRWWSCSCQSIIALLAACCCPCFLVPRPTDSGSRVRTTSATPTRLADVRGGRTTTRCRRTPVRPMEPAQAMSPTKARGLSGTPSRTPHLEPRNGRAVPYHGR